LNSFVNARRLRLTMDYSYRTFVRSGVSTKPGEVQTLIPPAERSEARIPRSLVRSQGRVGDRVQGDIDGA
jgi:hypothetical protein